MNTGFFGGSVSNYPNLSRLQQGVGPEKKLDKEKINPVTFLKVAYLLEPVFRSAMFLHSWTLYFFVKFLKAKFSLFRLAEESLLVLFLKIDTNDRRLVYWTYFLQLLLFSTLLLLITNYYISRGSTLSKKLLLNTNLQGQVALVTGGNSGIGYETVLQLLKWKCKVVIFCRNNDEGEDAVKRLKQQANFDESKLSFILCDLDDLKSIRKAVEQFLKKNKRLDLLINNAGIYNRKCEKTKFGLETNFSTNFLGHFYLTNLLLDLLKNSEARIINVSSLAHFRYDPKFDKLFETKSTTDMESSLLYTYYGRSKIFLIWFTHALQQKMIDDGASVMCFSVHPGTVKTKMVWPINGRTYWMVPRVLVPFILKRPVDGAATTLHLCAQDYKQLIPGGYYVDCNIGVVSKFAHDKENEQKLWNLAEELVEKYSK